MLNRVLEAKRDDLYQIIDEYDIPDTLLERINSIIEKTDIRKNRRKDIDDLFKAITILLYNHRDTIKDTKDKCPS